VVFDGPAAWLGYSMGGRIALAGAAEGLPMRRLLLESAGPGLATAAERAERRRVDRERAERLQAQGMEAFVDDWLRMPLFAGLGALPSEVRLAARAVRAAQEPARMAAWLRGGGTGSQRDYRPDLPRISSPVHLIAGARDEKYVALAREMASALPLSDLTVVPGAGHSVHLEAPDAWLSWVRSALR
jgi:2-succinyl-6-hydroxy-2,4-cyclohexadiene-1-carboxylate synthase